MDWKKGKRWKRKGSASSISSGPAPNETAAMMVEESSSIRLRLEDRMNNLPNSVLHHILSFLPTKTSVRTSLVCRRWRNLWKNLQTFNFCDNSHYMLYDHDNIKQFLCFTVFVNAVLSLRRSRDTRKFHLSCAHSPSDPFFAYSIETWIGTIVGPQLEEFHLTIHCLDGVAFNLPQPLLSCSNLVSVSLSGNILFQLQDSSGICLPSLKVLQLLLDMYLLDLNPVNIFLSACHVLEDLDMSFTHESLAILRVPTSLKRLKIMVETKVGACLEIDAPDLKFLSLTNVTISHAATIGNLHKVEEAFLDVLPTPESESVEPLLNLLRALSGIKHLELFSSTTKWLSAAPTSDFPEFHYLLRLHLQLFLLSYNFHFIFDMLHKCPILQTLITFNDKIDPSFDSSPAYGWEPKPQSVPKCLVSHLTFIKFEAYLGHSNELEFIGYVLQNGLVLKTVLIDDFYMMNQPEEWKEKIYDLPRGTMCHLKIH